MSINNIISEQDAFIIEAEALINRILVDDVEDNMILGNMLLMHDTKPVKHTMMNCPTGCKACTK